MVVRVSHIAVIHIGLAVWIMTLRLESTSMVFIMHGQHFTHTPNAIGYT